MRILGLLRLLIAIWAFAGLDPALALAANKSVLFAKPGWVLPGASIDMDFANGRYWQKKPSDLIISRASTETEICNGQLYTFAANQPAITPGCGLWIWEARTNSITNSTFQGAAVGTPGTRPTSWTNWPSPSGGVSVNVAGLPIVNGMQAIDMQFTGAATATTAYNAQFIGNAVAAASYGQTWTGSIYLSVPSGVADGITSTKLYIFTYTSGGAFVQSTAATINLTPTLQKYTISFTITSPTVAYVVLAEQINWNTGTTVNFTQRIVQPQLELNPNLSATVASAAVNAAGSGGTNGACVLTVAGGTGTAATLNGTISGGALTAIGSVASAGSYSVLPASPASVTGCGLSGATVDLTPVNNATKGLGTGPILTTNAPLTRAASSVYLAGQTPSLAYSFMCVGIPSQPSSAAIVSGLCAWGDGTLSNRVVASRTQGGGSANWFARNTGGTLWNATGTTWPTGSVGKLSGAYDGSTYFGAYNGVAVATATAASPPISDFHIGDSGVSASSVFNGVISRVALWQKVALSQAQLNAVTK